MAWFSEMLMPFELSLSIVTFSTINSLPDVKLMPLVPNVVPAPLIERLRNVTLILPGVAVAESLPLTRLVPLCRIEPKPAPFVRSIRMDLVGVTARNHLDRAHQSRRPK